MTIALLPQPKQSFLKALKIFPLDGTPCFCKIGAALLSRNRGRRREVQSMVGQASPDRVRDRLCLATNRGRQREVQEVRFRASFYTYYRVEQH
jgi:hypothetical protein